MRERKAREGERGKGEEIQKGGTECRGRERDIVRRFRNKRELLPVIQYREIDKHNSFFSYSFHDSSGISVF